jgi:hypothetical protein
MTGAVPASHRRSQIVIATTPNAISTLPRGSVRGGDELTSRSADTNAGVEAGQTVSENASSSLMKRQTPAHLRSDSRIAGGGRSARRTPVDNIAATASERHRVREDRPHSSESSRPRQRSRRETPHPAVLSLAGRADHQPPTEASIRARKPAEVTAPVEDPKGVHNPPTGACDPPAVQTLWTYSAEAGVREDPRAPARRTDHGLSAGWRKRTRKTAAA